MDKNEKKDISADELIRRLNMTLGIQPDDDDVDEDIEDDAEDTQGDAFSDTLDIEKEISDDINEAPNVDTDDDTQVSDDTVDKASDNEQNIEPEHDKIKKEAVLPKDDIELIDDTLTDIFTKKDDGIEFSDSLVGFSDTLDRLDDTVFQPAPMKKASNDDVSKIIKSDTVEKKRSFFNDAEFDDVVFPEAPSSSLVTERKPSENDMKEAFEEVTKTDINLNETNEDTKVDIEPEDQGDSEDQTIVAGAINEDPTVQFAPEKAEESEDKPEEEKHHPENHQLDYNQVYSSDEKSSDGYDDAQHEIMHAMDFSKALEDVYDNDISASQANISIGHIGEKTPQIEREISKSPNEFTNSAQRKPFLDKYKKLYTSARFKLIGAVLFTILVVILETFLSLGKDIPHFIDPVTNSRVLILVAFQLFLITFAFYFESFLKGISSLFTGKVTPLVLPTVFSVITIAFGVYQAITAPENPILMFAPCALCITASLLNEYRDIKREVSAFKIISSNRTKYCIGQYTPSEKTVESDDFYNYLPDNPTLLKINKTSFIENFTKNTNKKSKLKSYFLIVTLLCVLIAIVTFALFMIMKKGVGPSITYAFVLLSAIVPSSLLTAFSFPLYKASKEAFNDDSAFVGECVADDFSEAAVVSFDDKEVFPSYALKLLSVRVYGENRIDHILYAATSVFKKLGGPLYDVFENASREIEKTDNVKIFSVDTDGIEATVNEEHVLLGSAAFMETKNFIPLYTADDENAEAKNAKRIMYMASGGTIVAKLYLKYTADSDFSLILQHLTDAGMCIAVKTFDPNIDTELLAGEINIKKYPVRVVKCSDASELSETTQSSDAVIVSKSSAKSLLKTLTNCRKLSSVIKTGVLVSVVSIIIGIMIVAFSLFAGLEGGIASLVIVLYQLLWMLVCNIVSRVYLK